ncbi:MAG TPA: hypothetical protein VJ785_17920 [Anaerolineales bacterium]|nr:hypothetical protein [Anaerolineales bacterium]
MALKSFRSILIISFIITLLPAMIPSGSAHAMADPYDRAGLSSLDVFVTQVKNGQADELRGVFIQDILVAPIVQQPIGRPDYVSNRPNVVTQFSLAARFGSIGLLAHNDLAGRSFNLLQTGQKIHLVYGDGQVSTFIVSDVLQYQALEPENTTSSFIDPANNIFLTSSELFLKVYDRPGQVVFQTCIQAGDKTSWGRLFVVAEPQSQ